VRSLTAAVVAALVLLPATPAWAAGQAPVPVDDAVTYRNTGGIDYIVNALANDSDPDGDPLTYTAVTPATKGNAYLSAGKLYYKPFLGNTGTDSFTYTVSDGHGNTATGTVTATLWVDPAVPADLAISGSGTTSATLTWSAAARATTYRIYRNGVLVTETPALTFTDNGLTGLLSYEYHVVAVNGGGFEGPASSSVYRRYRLLTPYLVGVDLTEDLTALFLTWEDRGLAGPWNVYRDGTQIASVLQPEFLDTGLVTGRQYSYQVQHAFPSTSLEAFPASALSTAVRATPSVPTDIGRLFMDLGGSRGVLGPVSVPERVIPGGRQQNHYEGFIVQRDGEQAISVQPPLATTYLIAGSATGRLGFPHDEQECGLRDNGCAQFFDGGSIWTMPAGFAVDVPLEIEDGWAATGWEDGPLGYPTWGPEDLPGGGIAQSFEGGAVYFTEATGPHGVSGSIYDRWAATGLEEGTLGYPTSDEIASDKGLRQSFTGGTIWWSPTVGGQVVLAKMQGAWERSGWEDGPLGEPTGAEVALAGGGRYQKFQGGYIFWTASTGAWPIYGAMRTAWARNRSQTGPLGYPVTDQIALAGGGRYQKFQGGYIFWTASTGAWAVHGPIRTAWARTGSQTGPLGYPTSDETISSGKRRQSFRGGTITVDVATGRVTISYR
jgi:uncharacterized protein with LGFP repeats